MIRTPPLAVASTVLLALSTCPARAQQAVPTPEQRATALMTRVPLVDGHNDLPWALRESVKYDQDKMDIRKSQPALQTDIARLRAGQVGAQFWSVYVPSSLDGKGAVTATLEQIDAVDEILRRYPETFGRALTAADVQRVFGEGRIASLMGMEGGHSIDNSLGTLRTMFRLGVRYMTLTHGSNVAWADSATDTPRVGGLSAFGETVVREMNWLGMLVDLSHVSPEAMVDALRVSEAPVIFSHSSARALCDVARNVPDEVLRLLPRNGGVVMVTFVPSFISPEVAAWDRRLDDARRSWREKHGEDKAAIDADERRWRAENPAPVATLAQVADHIDHVRRVAGIDHVGLGSDFDGIEAGPAGLEDVSKFPALAAELLRRGYPETDVEKIMGLNVLRVMRAAEQVAARLQRSRPPSVATLAGVDGPMR
jgi:membrane dipeptidase